MQRQLGFFFNSDRCVQCHACEVACKSWDELEPGIAWRKVRDVWAGTFPDVTNKTLSFACMHCAQPACIRVCKAKAISKRPENGIVVVEQEKCVHCHSCLTACPFHIPQYGQSGSMQKCNFCMEKLAQGKQPSCVATCPGEALKCGTMEDPVRTAENGAQTGFLFKTGASMLVSGRLTEKEFWALINRDQGEER